MKKNDFPGNCLYFGIFFDHLKENFLEGIYDHTYERSEKQLQQFSPDDGA